MNNKITQENAVELRQVSSYCGEEMPEHSDPINEDQNAISESSVTMFSSVTSRKAKFISKEYVFKLIKDNNRIKSSIEELRKLDGEAYKDAKKKLAVIYFTGIFIGGQATKNMTSSSGYMIIDLDGYETIEELKEARKIIESNLHVLACFLSPSGRGLKVIIKIEPTLCPIEYKENFRTFKEYLKSPYWDNSGSDLARACFISHDPDLYVNPDSKVWTISSKETEIEKTILPISKSLNDFTNEQISNYEEIIKKLSLNECKNVELTPGKWNSGIHFYACRCNDYMIPEAIAAKLLWDKYNIDNTGYEQFISTIHSAYKSNESALKSYPSISPDSILSKEDSVVLNVVNSFGVTRNELTKKTEFIETGIPLASSDVNNIILQARSIIKNISDNAVLRVLDSKYVPSFHPFVKYIRSIAYRPLIIGVLDSFLACLILEDHASGYKERIVKKWLGGIMGTLMGSYAVTTLVLVGGQRCGKTSYFRELLPEPLRKYFAEVEITDDKDTMAIMSSNLICYNDEFTSKNKTEASIFKKMSSAENFTYRSPYGRISETRRRTAVLCGSANEPDVISDHTGNRRVIPVRVKTINLDKLRLIDRDDLYRELLELHKQNPVWWHLTSEDIEFMNSDTMQNTIIDPYEEQVKLYTIPDPKGHISTTEVEAHLANNNRAFRPNNAKLGRALTRVYGASKPRKMGGDCLRGYPIKLVVNNESNHKSVFEFDELL